MILGKIEPAVPSPGGAVAADLCRVAPDGLKLAFWVSAASDPSAVAARGLYVGELEWDADLGEAADRLWPGQDGVAVSDLAWSADGAWIAMLLSSGPPPGELRIGVLRVADGAFTELPGMSFAWLAGGTSMLVADPLASRVYVHDVASGEEQVIGAITDDADPHFAPVVAASPDGGRIAIVTRRVTAAATLIDLAHRQAGPWGLTPLVQMPGAGLRVLPFWSADARALALMILDHEHGRTTIFAAPAGDAAPQELYASATLDAHVTPAAHPDGRLIAIVRDHPDEQGGGPRKQVALVDPVEAVIAAIPGDAGTVRHLRWLDARTLLAEGTTAAWTLRLRVSFEPSIAPGGLDDD